MDIAEYDVSSAESLLAHAMKLRGKTLAQVVDWIQIQENDQSRGDLGSLVESVFFNYTPPSNHGPDFPLAGVELKTTGVLRRKDGSFRAKERLVLSMIDYNAIVNETWETSYVLQKCRLMLLVFYLYEKEKAVQDRRFIPDPMLFSIPRADFPVLKRDWETIQAKVRNGLAHELSEGDTLYLGACRKGTGGANEALRSQPFSATLAKSRAFSLKPGYINLILDGEVGKRDLPEVSETMSLEDASLRRLRAFIGKTTDQISRETSILRGAGHHKGFKYALALGMLGASGKSVPEFEKAGITLKTIPKTHTGRVKESMSFQGFRFEEIVSQEWEKSRFAEMLEQKFLFVVFRAQKDGSETFESAFYWNMPAADIEQAHAVWEETKKRIRSNPSELPKASESRVAHVRPKGKNAADMDVAPDGSMHTKKAFWLNSSYIQEVVNEFGKP
ncbi:MAG TPA: Sau3AI family type II restriction endonuclease [Microbacteriaceae bacterium]|nr:Sau3AI family type II restriction endonuclease [Microbacteriaceae bacterium]